jgi:hypothetical protein
MYDTPSFLIFSVRLSILFLRVERRKDGSR